MAANDSNTPGNLPGSQDRGFKIFAAKRILVGLVLTAVALWLSISVLGWLDKPPATAAGDHAAETAAHEETAHHQGAEPDGETAEADATKTHSEPVHAAQADVHAGEADLGQETHGAHDIRVAGHGEVEAGHGLDDTTTVATLTPDAHGPSDIENKDDHASNQPAPPDAHGPAQHPAPEEMEKPAGHGADDAHAPAPHGAETDDHADKGQDGHDAGHGTDAGHAEAEPEHRAKGVAFIEATITPMDYELNKRFYRWRPNDIVEIGDNVISFQLGVLEVTRRTAVILAERISRTGSTAAFDPNLESAMNFFMVKADEYWFPSAESKYNDALNEMREYRERLELGEANFYTRTDNLIPLLMAYEDLLGSCDENLVKHKEKDGRKVKNADAYFFYAKGVASSMRIILEAIHHDFDQVLEARRGSEVLHHAIESCHHAAEIDPWVITDSDLSGILANHRANMAAPISHARFYLGVLIKALST
jgi:hypothetical protein